MKKNNFLKGMMLVVGLLILAYGPAYAVDLTCDDAPIGPADSPTNRAQLRFDNMDYIEIPVVPGLTPNTVRILYGLDAVTVGPHSVTGRFGNIWGWSPDAIPLEFTKSLPPAMRLFILPTGP